MPNYKLVYFNVTNRAEPARQMFYYKNVPFEDIRPEFPEWMSKWKIMSPFGGCPLLFCDGSPKPICQSMAINRALAREFDLNGSTKHETIIADMVSCGVDDLQNAFEKVWHTSKEDLPKYIKDFGTEKVTPWNKNMTVILLAEGGPWMAGKTLTYADFCVANMMGMYERFGGDPKLFSPPLQDLRKRVEELPGVKEWIAKRPKGP